jgi:tRNA(Ile)-lysidine synthase
MHGHKKLKDFFIDLKIPLSERKRIPILTFKEIPVWICGIRIDDRFKVTQTTRKVLRVTINKKNRTLSIPK